MPPIETANLNWRPARATAQTATAFGTTYVTTSDPTSGAGVFKGESGRNLVVIQPYAAMGNDTTFTFRVNGIRKVNSVGATADTWIRTPIASFVGTASTATGVAGGLVGTADRFADSLAKTFGASTVEVIEPGANAPGRVVVDVEGAENVEFEFTGTAVNALVSFL